MAGFREGLSLLGISEKTDQIIAKSRRQSNLKNLCPSITQDLLNKALNFANKYIYISKCDIDIIHHVWKSLLFDGSIPGLRNKETYLMCQWVLMMELKCASSWTHIC